MAVIKMQKMTLVAHKKDRRNIMKTLASLGTCEIAKSKEYDETAVGGDTAFREELEGKIQNLNFAFAFLKEIHLLSKSKQMLPHIEKTKANFGRENLLISYDELSGVMDDEYELFSIIDGLKDMNSRLVDIKSEKSKLKNLLEELSPYTPLPMRFGDIKSTKETTITLGTVPSEGVEKLKESMPEGSFLYTLPSKNVSIVISIALSEVKDEVQKLLHTYEFARCPFDDDLTPLGMYNDTQNKLEKLDDKVVEIVKEGVGKLKYLSNFKYLYDYYSLERTKLDIIKEGRETSKVFVLDAWVPEPQAELTADALSDVAPTMQYVLREPMEGETPPSFVKNSKPVSAFGDVITSTFGAPKYGGIEPNIFVAFFYFLFFGFMLGDAGYGVLMASFCFGYLIIKKPVKNSGSFMLMFGLCGISTIMWGAFFGGWFGLEGDILEGGAFGRFLLSLKQLDPLDGTQTLIMFGMALGLGVVHIATGFVLNGVSKLKTAPLDGIMNDFGWVVIFLGGAVFGLDFLLKTGVVNIIGIVVLLTGVAMLCVGGALGKKNPIKMVTGAVGNLYGSINIFSDILSYARLFGLGLTTGIIGLVVNRIGAIFVDMIPFYLGYVVAVPIWIGGHMFNLGINALGVYVHNSRLQYVEFFGKFYTGEGKAFKPFGGSTKYIFLSDSLSQKTK